VLGGLGFMTTTPLQMLIMQKARHAPTLASAGNQSAFNLANAGGAWLGGVAIAAGWGWRSPMVVGAVLALVGLGIAVLAGVLDRGRPSFSRSRIVARGGVPRLRRERAAEGVPG
jgi:MFS transporter, DHA1 family, inner membrane transport protein